MNDFNRLLKTSLIENHLTLDPSQVDKLTHYLTLLQTWNKVFNLTSITNPHDMVYLHLIDSLVVNPYLRGSRCLDVGTGAGLPGIPLAILNPDRQWTLLDKNQKKVTFLNQVIAELQLNHVKAIKDRCENFNPDYPFDIILSRAFSSLSLFLNTTKHLLKEDGIFLAMKGKYPQDELNEIPTEFGVKEVIRLTINGIDIERHLVILKKT